MLLKQFIDKQDIELAPRWSRIHLIDNNELLYVKGYTLYRHLSFDIYMVLCIEVLRFRNDQTVRSATL